MAQGLYESDREDTFRILERGSVYFSSVFGRKKMYRILIVDDEPLILAGISSLLSWEEYQCRIVGKAANGCKALDLYWQLRPDIVITDIKMPAMDGITFMKKVREGGGCAAFILLTNLEEFALAKEALRLGAVDYLVKLELEEESLTSAKKKAVEICEYNRKKGIVQGEQGDVFEDTLEEKIQNYFQRILIYDARIKGQEAVENIIGERYGNMALMLINFNYGFEGFSPAFTREDQKKVMDFAENIISGMVKGFFEYSCLLRRDQNGFILVLSLEDQKDYETQIQVMSRKFRQVMKDYFEVPVSIAVSQPGGEAQDLLYQAMSAMNQTYYENSEETVFYSARCEKDVRHSSNFNINFLKKDMAAAVGQNDSRRFGKIMDQVISLFEECRPARTQAVNACSNLYYFFVFLMEGEKDQSFPYAVDIIGHLNRMEHLKSILKWLEGFRDEVVRVLDLRGEVKIDRNVELARKYVAEHYKEKISLGQVAQALNLSSGHLSSVFRKQTGQKFSDYVTEVKIEKAKELIRTHQYMMYEISDMLGFDTQYYFSTVFKKMTGLTPKEYETAKQDF